MINKRSLLLGAAALMTQVSLGASTQAEAHHTNKRRRKKPFKLAEKYKPQRVFFTGYSPGTIVVDPKNHFLYQVESPISARRYGVGVGREGVTWKGDATIRRKAEWPTWTPPAEMRARERAKGIILPVTQAGGIDNPLGARALYLYKNNRDTYYRIHGTTQPSSIGRSVSAGCIRRSRGHGRPQMPLSGLLSRDPAGLPQL